MSQCNKSVSQGCNAIKTRLTRAIPLKPALCVSQGCIAVKTRLARALIPLKPAPVQESSAKEKIVDLLSNVFDYEKVNNNDDITFFSLS